MVMKMSLRRRKDSRPVASMTDLSVVVFGGGPESLTTTSPAGRETAGGQCSMAPCGEHAELPGFVLQPKWLGMGGGKGGEKKALFWLYWSFFCPFSILYIGMSPPQSCVLVYGTVPSRQFAPCAGCIGLHWVAAKCLV